MKLSWVTFDPSRIYPQCQRLLARLNLKSSPLQIFVDSSQHIARGIQLRLPSLRLRMICMLRLIVVR